MKQAQVHENEDDGGDESTESARTSSGEESSEGMYFYVTACQYFNCVLYCFTMLYSIAFLVIQFSFYFILELYVEFREPCLYPFLANAP